MPDIRIGHGYDLHRLEPLSPEGVGKTFIMAGVTLEHDRGPVGHSDGDVVYHAVTDAMLGALGEPDIGQLFPDTDPRWKNADSAQFLIAATQRMCDAGYEIANVDVTVVCERPKISGHKTAMIENLAQALGCRADLVNLKGKTHERVDAVGEGRAVEAHVVVLLQKPNLSSDHAQ